MLVAAALGTGVGALFGSRLLLLVHVSVDVVAVAYGILVYRAGRERLERVRTVRTLTRHPLATRTTTWPTPAAAAVELDDPLFAEEQLAL